MLKKTITFKDLDGNFVTEEFYFNLNKMEAIEIAGGGEDNLHQKLQKITDGSTGYEIMTAFKDILSVSIGRRSDDNRYFEKTPAIASRFLQSNAYEVLFMELVTNAESAEEFVVGVLPSDLDIPITPAKGVTDLSLPASTEEPDWLKSGREPTRDELMKASPEQLQEAFRRKQNPN